MPSEPLDWKLVRFPECIERWTKLESPSDDQQLVVLDWVMSRHDDPYRGMRRAEGFENLWFGAIPGTEPGWAVVTCSSRRRALGEVWRRCGCGLGSGSGWTVKVGSVGGDRVVGDLVPTSAVDRSGKLGAVVGREVGDGDRDGVAVGAQRHPLAGMVVLDEIESVHDSTGH